MLGQPPQSEGKNLGTKVHSAIKNADKLLVKAIDRSRVFVKTKWEDFLYNLEEHPRLTLAAPFLLNLAATAYSVPFVYAASDIVQSEYKMTCYYDFRESADKNPLCRVAKGFGIPSHEDFSAEIAAKVKKDEEARIPAIQKACQDEVGQWMVGAQHAGNYTYVDCEDTNADGIPDAIHYSGSGEDVSFNLRTGEET